VAVGFWTFKRKIMSNVPIREVASGDRVLVTGGTGLLGSHVVERLVARGSRVRALVRPGSRTGFLDSLGVELVVGDLTDPASCARAARGVRSVFHCAAKVGDWGAWPEFQAGCVDATRIVAQAALEAGVDRFVHISSTSAYGHPPDSAGLISEEAALGQNVWPLDHYTRAKVECERLLWEMQAARGLPLTIIRPSWLYGERDRTTVGRFAREFRRGRVLIVGPGTNPLSAVYAGVVADAAILASEHPGARGEAFNITNQGPITQQRFLDLFADALGFPRARRHIPYRLAYAGGFLLEMRGRLLRLADPPRVTRYGVWLLGRFLDYSTEKARTKLGWFPGLTYEESIGRSARWFLESEASARAGGESGADYG